ncbi:hypothetical protein IMZ31_23295 (plasmid) [Pontibacillus sp. ALD_SL1]|uniref:hypothetical protein n=1 Tax=Pontibacillus sp. ALD_SL1 TaxID=2777185 RepID=UPI001A95F07F|nr:hypothetical protein [Pontibacillus sp. ALD_SL1]QST02378.1 hypothetical protein IMZ31_23295 [Pontibacillus sp. ALD_SL1]
MGTKSVLKQLYKMAFVKSEYPEEGTVKVLNDQVTYQREDVRIIICRDRLLHLFNRYTYEIEVEGKVLFNGSWAPYAPAKEKQKAIEVTKSLLKQ